MSDVRVRVELIKLNTREQVDQVERALQTLGVEIHELGLSEATLSYDQHSVTQQDLEQAVRTAGGALGAVRREE